MAKEIRCPGCGWSAVEDARTGPPVRDGDSFYTVQARERLLVVDPERCDQLEFFDVLGADFGNVFCTICSCEFNPDDSVTPTPWDGSEGL